MTTQQQLEEKKADIRTITLEARRSSIACLHQEWMSVKKQVLDGKSFSVNCGCGAGLGNPYLIMQVEYDGKSIIEIVDMSVAWTLWIDAMVEDLKNEEPNATTTNGSINQ